MRRAFDTVHPDSCRRFLQVKAGGDILPVRISLPALKDIEQTVAYLKETLTLSQELGLPGEQWPIWAKLGKLYQTRGEPERVWQTLGQVVEIKHILAAKIDDENRRTAFLAEL